jgi:hypothetical protein
MKASNILSDLRRPSGKRGAESGFDPKLIGKRMREQQRVRALDGAQYVSFAKFPRPNVASAWFGRNPRVSSSRLIP